MAQDMQYHFRTVGEAMYAPCARSSFASVCSTKFSLDVTFFALSFGTVWPQFVHWTTPEDPFPPLVRPRLARFNGMPLCQIPYLYLWVFEQPSEMHHAYVQGAVGITPHVIVQTAYSN